MLRGAQHALLDQLAAMGRDAEVRDTAGQLVTTLATVAAHDSGYTGSLTTGLINLSAAATETRRSARPNRPSVCWMDSKRRNLAGSKPSSPVRRAPGSSAEHVGSRRLAAGPLPRLSTREAERRSSVTSRGHPRTWSAKYHYLLTT